jgi:Ni/Fe-hydrogenase subunit HybB-like protein
VPFEQAGFLTLGNDPPPALTEQIQHGVFKHWIAPVGWYSFLATMFWFTGRRERVQNVTVKQLAHENHVSHHPHAAPIQHTLFTRGVLFLLSLVLVGAAAFVWRMIGGLGATTHLDQQRPWGLWIAMDVGSGIALAGGGFVACAIFHVFHRNRYHLLARSALVCALLGYTFYVPGLLADLGKWWKLPITMLPTCWQGNSVLFEVGMCVMLYLTVQYAELTPIICERLLGENWFKRWPRFHRLTGLVERVLNKIMPALLCMGVCLSTFHQSSLGNLLVIAPYKLHHLWWSPVAPLHFL